MSASLSLRTIFLDIGAVVKTVPHPQSHVLGDEQCLGSNRLVVEIGSDVDESGQLLMNGIVRRPHTVAVVVGTVLFDEHTVLGRDGVEIAIAIFLGMLLVHVKSRPRALHILQFAFRGQVACLPIAS